ncbi:NAD-dependent epimerase/dehydratase family protein [Bacillus sp. P14.5]|uniref:NAD-dependent epimerase/dehydratase family protein n=1 Tax=Bacillus sp. P14.5 TaxID=1983400 RepID=UPI000DEB4719|nr:NAD-dependent epimerase/dehydratase family protein [Bacillus sp. P14.5]
MTARLLITGASGFTGTEACRYFASKGYSVTGMARKSMGPAGGVQYEVCDLLCKEEMDRFIEAQKPDYILHLAGDNHAGESWNRPLAAMETNVNGTLNLLEAVRRHSPSARSLVAGSMIDYDPCKMESPNHPYGVTKYLQTLTAKCWGSLYNMDVVIARPSNLIGPGESSGICALLASKLAEMERGSGKGKLEIHNLKSQRDFLDIRDVVKAYETLLLKGESLQEYSIGSGVSRTLGEVAETLVKLTDADVEVSYSLDEEEAPFRVDGSKIRYLGWIPGIPFQQSMEDVLAYYRSRS